MRKFYRTEITCVVLSEDPISPNMDIAEVIRECNDGYFVLHSSKQHSARVTKKEMIKLLYAAGSEPGFFQIEE